MKTLTKLLFLMLVTLSLSCTKNDSLANRENTNNNSTNVENSNNTNNDTLCTFQSIVLDTSDLVSINKTSIIYNWKLIAYADLSDCSFITEPKDIEKSVEINFKDSENVSGHTLGNTFEGKYLIQNDSIQFIDLLITLVKEPEWGEKFTYAIYNSDLVTIKNDTLIIYYSQSKKAMIFSKQ